MRSVSQSVVIDAPIEPVFRLTNRVEDWPSSMDDYAGVEVIAQDGWKTTFRLKHKNGTEWISWRVIDPEARVALAERVTPRAPFKFMHHLWTYRPLDAGRTEMTWTMAFELPEAQAHREDECARYLLEHSTGNQARMKKHVEIAVLQESEAKAAE
jgi:aromatase